MSDTTPHSTNSSTDNNTQPEAFGNTSSGNPQQPQTSGTTQRPVVYALPAGIAITVRVHGSSESQRNEGTNASSSTPSSTNATSESTTQTPPTNTNNEESPNAPSVRTLVFNLPIFLMVTPIEENASTSATPTPNSSFPFPFPFPFPNGPSFEDILQQSFMQYQQQRNGPAPATQEQLNQFVKEQCVDKETADICTVCQTNFELGEKMITLPCTHCYHSECGLTWLKQHNTCPVCRASLPQSTSVTP